MWQEGACKKTECWHGYLSGTRCRLPYGPADATATHYSLSLASVKARLVLPFWYWLTWVVQDKGLLNGCVLLHFFCPAISKSLIAHGDHVIGGCDWGSMSHNCFIYQSHQTVISYGWSAAGVVAMAIVTCKSHGLYSETDLCSLHSAAVLIWSFAVSQQLNQSYKWISHWILASVVATILGNCILTNLCV